MTTTQRNVLYMDSKLGVIELVAQGNAIVSIGIVSEHGQNRVNGQFIGDCATQLEEYFAGSRRCFDFPLKLRGTDFQKSVWRALLEIPYGETRSYKDICLLLGREKAARAVGNAAGKNPVLVVVPCHRVISSDGGLGGFSAGLDLKKHLLALESEA